MFYFKLEDETKAQKMMLNIFLLILASNFFTALKCSEYGYEEKMIKDEYYDGEEIYEKESNYNKEESKEYNMQDLYKEAENEYKVKMHSKENDEYDGNEAPKCPGKQFKNSSK